MFSTTVTNLGFLMDSGTPEPRLGTLYLESLVWHSDSSAAQNGCSSKELIRCCSQWKETNHA